MSLQKAAKSLDARVAHADAELSEAGAAAAAAESRRAARWYPMIAPLWWLSASSVP